MKEQLKNIILIGLLILVNLSIFIFCWLLTDSQNYLWYKTSPESIALVKNASLEIMRVNYFVYANGINFILLGTYYAYYHKKTLGLMVSLLGGIIFWGGTILFEESSAENYYTIFKHQSVSEDFMLEPVKSGGKLMAKKLVNDLSTPNSFKKFAIRGLGVLQDESSIPLLNQLLYNTQETDLYRGEAYLALVTMNTEESTRYASLFLEVADPVLDKEVIKYIKMRAPHRVN